MNSIYLFFKIITFSLLFGGFLCAYCPNDENTINPCKCIQAIELIMCTEVGTNFSLTDVFQNLSSNLDTGSKNFKTLGLYYTGITSLEDNVFLDITFEVIYIYENNLTQIHVNSFQNMAQTLKSLTLKCNHLNIDQSEYNLFNILSSFVNIENINLEFQSNSVEVPQNAFHIISDSQTKLLEIIFWSNFKTVNNNSFAELPNLRSLRFSHNKLEFLASEAFDFIQSSNQRLFIDLNSNQLSDRSFETGVFLNSKRPLYIDLENNGLRSLDINIFCPFFQINENGINLRNNELDCNCHMYWIIKQKSWLISRIDSAKCKNGLSIWETEWDCPESEDNLCEHYNSSNQNIYKSYSYVYSFLIIFILNLKSFLF